MIGREQEVHGEANSKSMRWSTEDIFQQTSLHPIFTWLAIRALAPTWDTLFLWSQPLNPSKAFYCCASRPIFLRYPHLLKSMRGLSLHSRSSGWYYKCQRRRRNNTLYRCARNGMWHLSRSRWCCRGGFRRPPLLPIDVLWLCRAKQYTHHHR